MRITIETQNHYGKTRVYPVCARAHSFCKIAKTKTLTDDMLSHIMSLGYEVVEEHASYTLPEATPDDNSDCWQEFDA